MSLIQWFVFRDRLALWWIGANTIAATLFGWLHEYLLSNSPWGSEQVWILFVYWLIGNLVLGYFLMRSGQEKSENVSAIPEIGARQNIFLMLLAVSLALAAISNFILLLEVSGAIKFVWTLYSLSAILVSIAFFVKKDIPRNLGFITLAIFMLLDGINVVQLAFNSDYPLYYFSLNGIMALASGIYFVSRKETWQNMGFILLAGFLISNGLAGIASPTTDISHTFLVLASIFAVPASIFLFVRK